ncbi:Minor tail protein [Nocardia ninae]|uniref:Uncharacterized protein n=1 Tax=Nocardia ninae NBRC 108245 TaxID=1210091 RepID=A0A511MN04_9NOCA|nr:hypothetical protein [Nocardia ninae]GEM41993.1 hypothetical protein NN4_65120 [Nocardia ninae NBRC 108245]
MPVRAGDTNPAKYYVGDAIPSAVYCGDLLVWPIYPAVGMNKSGTHTVTTSFADVAGWVVDPERPGSALSGTTGLVVQQGKSGAKITASLFGTNPGFNAATLQLRATVNNAVVGAAGTAVSLPGFNGTGTAELTVTGVNVAVGDVVRLQAVASAGLDATAPGWVRVS